MRKRNIDTPIGAFCLVSNKDSLVRIEWERDKGAENSNTKILVKAERQLKEYFQGKRHDFDLPLSPEGTPFRKKVWQACRRVPYGRTASYKWLAGKTGSPGACRAVGGAMANNPLPIIVPCHRIKGSGKWIGGYSGGKGLKTKRQLLQLEGRS